MGQNLRVRLRGEGGTALLELFTERLEVLDDAVVDHDESTGRVRVGVGVDVARLAVGRPAGVADADGSGERLEIEQTRQPIDLPLGLPDMDGAVGDGDARRVVAPVLEPTQTVEQQRSGLPGADISHDSAHARVYLL